MIGAGKDEADREPPESLRGLSPERRTMTYEMVERGAPMVSAGVADARRDRVAIDDPDRELVERWQRGDERAFESLVRRHEARVFRLLLRMMGSREEAEDITQETFLSLHRHGHRFRAESRFSTFVYRVAANAALNRRRTLGRSRKRVQKLMERNAAGDDLPSAPRGPEDAVAGRELGVHVRAALQKLSPALRMPVVLYDIEGLAYGEIARILGVAEGTVKSRIHRARQALRLELQELLAGTAEEDAL
jgi:RNA polymerase sigma-70 factor (ECF subfamily)